MKPRTLFALALTGLLASLGASRSASAQQDPQFEPPPPPPDDEAPGAIPPAAQPPPAPPDEALFRTQLSPYGRWVQTPDYGWVWQPGGVAPDWQPYADGQWVSTTYGWSFVAPVPWGWAVYHYGRWGWRAGFGWYWVPGYVWGPGWVSWRWTNGYACWAPLGPRGYVYGPRWHGWVVVPHAHFTAPIHRWAVPRAQVNVIVRSARPVRGFPTWHARAYSRGGGWHHGGGRRH